MPDDARQERPESGFFATQLRNVYDMRCVTHWRPVVRTNIEIDDKLMKQAMKASGARTKRETVAKALELLVRIDGQKAIRKLCGKIEWEGDIDAWRRSERSLRTHPPGSTICRAKTRQPHRPSTSASEPMDC